MPRFIVPLLFLVALASPKPIDKTAAPDILYTKAQRYEPLAWMHGADRFSSDASIVLLTQSSSRPFLPRFEASADPAVSFDGLRVLFAGKAQANDPWQIWEVEIGGGKPRRITKTSDDCVRPFYLPDDRIVYSCKHAGHFEIEASDLESGKPLTLTYGPASFLPSDVLQDGRILLEAAYPLGSDSIPELYTVYSDGSGFESYRCDHGRARHSAKQVSSGEIVFAERGLAKFTSARAQQIAIAAPSGDYSGDVAEIAPGDWLLSWRLTSNTPYRLMRWAPDAKQLIPVADDAAANFLQPVVIGPHPASKRHPSGLHDWPNANLLCLNAYTSKYSFAPGSISKVQFYTPDGNGAPKLLGAAPVEADGSFFVQVPGDQPLQIELLDAAGKTLKREAGFFWMRRGEQRGCVGCHAGPEISPENAVPKILLKSTTPADLTGAAAPSASGGH